MINIRCFFSLLFVAVNLSSLIIKPVQAQEPVSDPRFGIVEAFWDSGAAYEAGVGWERILFYWSHIQPDGPDDWNTLHVPDEWLQDAAAHGREVVGLLKNTPQWAAVSDPPLDSSPPRGLDLPVDDPGNLWANFVRRVVAHYGQRGVHRWIIWNEPDIKPGVYGEEWGGTVEEYYRLLKVSYLVIKQIDPAASIHLAGLTFWHDQQWLDRFLTVVMADPEAAANNYFFDIVSLHIYFQTDTVDYIINMTRAALARFGLQKPIWINETNASPNEDPLWPVVRPIMQVDLQEQASFILQAYALALAAGAQRIAVYKLIDAGLPPGGEPFGLMRPDHSRRPAFTAYQLVTGYYAGTQSAQIVRNPLWTQVILFHPDRTVQVLWARTAIDVALTLDAMADTAMLVDQEGNVLALDGSGGSYTLNLGRARCADDTLGCIIGGPTYLLIENVAGIPGSPSGQAVAETISSPGLEVMVEDAATITITSSISMPAPITLSITLMPEPLPVVTNTPTANPTLDLPAPTMTIASSTLTPEPVVVTTVVSVSPTADVQVTALLTPSPVPSPTPETPVVSGHSLVQSVIGGIVLVLFASGLVFWLERRGKTGRKPGSL